MKLITSLIVTFALTSGLSHSMAAGSELERGAYIVRSVAACGNCHSPLGPDGPVPGQELSGRFVIKMPIFEAWASNITPAAIGNWTDAEVGRAIREGIRPDGSLIGPPMPIELYRDLSDSDVGAIVAYLRSVPAVENTVPRSTYNIPLPESYGPPVANVAPVPEGETAEYGAYLAGPVAHCIECHTPMVEGHFDFEHQLGAGGRAFEGSWGISVSANLTPHPDGLARWTDDEVISMIRTGKRPDGSPMSPPMGFAFYAGMTDRDARAIVAYLRTLPARQTP
ncbi:MAG TPA: c-type cytochrome [Thermohalobaculum sp.]|nr:c-type cytochrome [Thermohalobaculum sp.]